MLGLPAGLSAAEALAESRAVRTQVTARTCFIESSLRSARWFARDPPSGPPLPSTLGRGWLRRTERRHSRLRQALTPALSRSTGRVEQCDQRSAAACARRRCVAVPPLPAALRRGASACAARFGGRPLRVGLLLVPLVVQRLQAPSASRAARRRGSSIRRCPRPGCTAPACRCRRCRRPASSRRGGRPTARRTASRASRAAGPCSRRSGTAAGSTPSSFHAGSTLPPAAARRVGRMSSWMTGWS